MLFEMGKKYGIIRKKYIQKETNMEEKTILSNSQIKSKAKEALKGIGIQQLLHSLYLI
ncbi:hypothetical protein JTT07_09260 [Clostridium botulinum]|nr:hypothetical protein [Clostridium botulinum]